MTAALGVTTGGAAIAAPAKKGKVLGARAAGVVKDSYIVVLKNKSASAVTVQSTASSLTRTHGGVVKRTYANALKGFSAQMSAAQAERVAARPEVAYVAANRKVKAYDVQTPPSWGLDRIDEPYLPLGGSYTYPAKAASNVHAYVIDTGIEVNHGDFEGRASLGPNFSNEGDPNLSTDCHGHGTHVAGTIGGAKYGVAKGVQLVGVRVLNCAGEGTDDEVIAGIEWVTQNAVKPAVANLSLGGAGVSTVLNEAVTKSINSGVTYAIAAGNDGWDSCFNSPASTPAAITVGATDKADRRAGFSNFGRCVDVFAPGVGITSAWYNQKAPNMLETRSLSGTSMATPHVTGAAALLLGATPNLTPQQVRDKIVGGAVSGAVTDPGVGSPNKLLQVGAAATDPGTVLRLRASANNQVVTADSGGNSPLIANRTTPGLWEEFDVVPSGDGDGSVGLRSHANGRYVTAESGGTAPLVARGTQISLWEKFILSNTNGVITLKAVVNGKYVSAESAGGRPLIANRTSAGAWEQFTVAAASSVVSMVSYANGLLVTAESGGGRPLIARGGAFGPWEKYDAVDLGNGYIALRSYANGRYVTAESAGGSPLIANRTGVGAWEMFKVVYNDDNSVSLLANANGRYVTAESGGGSPLIARGAVPGLWEQYEFLSDPDA
ncbi:S8 family serine peptidase [Planosporangium mesophilum]|uniref:S8 family serine peptidase n=3 Tax=Planosporangium mesophilum TaxID=689768 RepID=UPI00143BDA94|nr:S8 family serine peptidase [Planosporangium mesophilum]